MKGAFSGDVCVHASERVLYTRTDSGGVREETETVSVGAACKRGVRVCVCVCVCLVHGVEARADPRLGDEHERRDELRESHQRRDGPNQSLELLVGREQLHPKRGHGDATDGYQRAHDEAQTHEQPRPRAGSRLTHTS